MRTRITNGPVKRDQEGGPGGGNATKERDQVARADNIHRAAEKIGGKRRAHQGRVSSIGATVDGDFLGVSNALFDGPLNGVHQVVMHFAAPLSVARAQKLFAV